MNHTRYIKFNYHNNHFMLATMDTVQNVFCNYLFDVNMSWYSNSPIKDEYNFGTRWKKFDEFIERRYGGNVDNFARRLATLITVSNYIYHDLLIDDYLDIALSKKIVDNESIVKGIKNYLIPETKVKCDISFVNEIDTDEDWNSETIYLDMSTGYIEVQ